MAAPLTTQSVFTAATGMKLPVIGLGTFLSSEEEPLVRALNRALELGYCLIDTAFLYQNEAIIGRVLSQWISSGKLRREDIFITTKLPPQGNNPKYVKEFLQKQLKALQLDYVDLYLVHHAVGWKHDQEIHHSEGDTDNSQIQLDLTTDHVAVWKEMENLVDAGLTKYIGLSNYNIKQVERILKHARIPPSNLQIELYLYSQSREEQEFCRNHGLTVTSYATLGSQGVPQGLFSGASLNPLLEAVVGRIATAHGKSPAQVLLRHVVQSGVAVIPKSTNPDRLKQNIDIFDFELQEDEMRELNALDRGEEGRRFILAAMEGHPENPYPRKAK